MELLSRHIINIQELGQVANTRHHIGWHIQVKPSDQIATKRTGFFSFQPIQ